MDKTVDFSFLSVAEETASLGSAASESAAGAAAAELPQTIFTG